MSEKPITTELFPLKDGVLKEELVMLGSNNDLNSGLIEEELRAHENPVFHNNVPDQLGKPRRHWNEDLHIRYLIAVENLGGAFVIYSIIESISKELEDGQCGPSTSSSSWTVDGRNGVVVFLSVRKLSNLKSVLVFKGRDGGGPSECDHHYHNDNTRVVALSTGWYNGGSRCLNKIIISANGRSVDAQVVDECDSTMGCDDEHDYQPPCSNNIVDASKAVWKALGLDGNVGEFDITWTDA
ncbi:putative ripening-related protein 1 [Heracleum sosnowskyi]|uniref:Ripening-related protein 1 n=1 Tax=Heracleum sosnowskyi TaxID=360622 RepID=A0AAD8M887_9APIA|nr:putative ripening-related protein 1 [Heracleum sosnowskyi]